MCTACGPSGLGGRGWPGVIPAGVGPVAVGRGPAEGVGDVLVEEVVSEIEKKNQIIISLSFVLE